MKTEIENITEKILDYSPNPRAYLAEILLESLDYEEDFEISKEWINVIKNRCCEIDNGTVELISGTKGLENLKNKYA